MVLTISVIILLAMAFRRTEERYAGLNTGNVEPIAASVGGRSHESIVHAAVT